MEQSSGSPTPRSFSSAGSPSRPRTPADFGDSHSLAMHLEPILQGACEGKLGEVEWFHSAWQHGGAATGFAAWNDGQSGAAPMRAFIKFPVGPDELAWSRDLAARPCGERGPFVPRYLAGGESMGGIDLCWIVVEALNGDPLSTGFDETSLREMLRTIVEFQVAAAEVRPDHPPCKVVDWSENVWRAKAAIRDSGLPLAETNRWLLALKHVYRALPVITARWHGRAITTWCHGDLHPGNVIRRTLASGDPRCVLIDLALVHPGHWCEDAIYLERQFWGHEEQLHGIKPLAELARLRREAGLPSDTHDTDVAIARRLLMAAVVPLFLNREHNAKYVHGALETIEKYLPQIH